MGKAAYQTEQAMKQMKKDAEAMGKAMGAMAVVAAGGLAVMVKMTIDAADNLRDMSQKTGIAVETLNGLGFAAGQAGGSLETMVGAAGKLNKSISEAAGGNKEISEAFKALGIAVLDAEGNLKKADVVMAEVADKFETFQDGPEKAALALRIFSKAGADMIPLLNDGGAAMRENTEYAQKYSGMTTELANASDNFNDTMGKLTLQQTGFANEMTKAVLPILQAVADETLNAAEQSNMFATAAAAVRIVLQTLVVTGSEVAFTFRGVGDSIGLMIAMDQAMLSGDFKGARAMGTAAKESWAEARASHDKFIASVMAAPVAPAAEFGGIKLSEQGGWGGKPNAPRLGGTGSASAKGAGKDLDADFKAYMKGLEGQIQKTQELTVVEKLLADIRGGSLTVSGQQQQTLTALAATIDKEKELVETLKIKRDVAMAMGDAVSKDNEEYQKQAAQNTANVEQIRVGLLSEVDQESLAHELRLAELQTFHDLKLENVTQANALMEAETARHAETLASMELESAQTMLGLAQSSAGQLYSALKDAGLEQTALGKAMFFAQKAIQVATIIVNTEVAAAAAQAGMIAAAGATAAVSGPAGPAIIAAGIAAGAAYAATTRVLGYATAGIVAGTALSGAREKGGSVWGGGAFLVGEKGPEIFKPSGSGTIVPNSQIGGGGEAMKLTIVNNTSVPIGQVTEQRISPTERALIIQEAVGATAAQFGDPNSKTSRAMGRNFNAQRTR